MGAVVNGVELVGEVVAAAVVAAAASSRRAFGQSRRQWLALPHFVHFPSAAHCANWACCASALCFAARSIGAEPRCGVAPVESAGLVEWGIRFLCWVLELPLAGRPPGGFHSAARRRIWLSRSLILVTYSVNDSFGGGRVLARAPFNSLVGQRLVER